MEKLRELYKIYYYSLPSERWKRKKKHRFKAKSFEEMTDLEMMRGASRDEAEKNLEQYLDESISNGTLVWQESWGSWFYADTECPTLILLKEWFN